MKISHRHIQIGAILLILLAGWLWSRSLAEQVYLKSIANLSDASADHIQLIQDRTDTKKDPYQLVSFGRQLLGVASPRLAIIPLEKAVDLMPGYRDAWYLLGYSYAQLASGIGKYSGDTKSVSDWRDLAINALNKAKDLDPRHQPTLDLLKQLSDS